jgi:uncharacterized protein (DUF2461 family)
MTTVAAERVTGFPSEALAILGELKAHNEKPWFEDHRKAFEETLVAPGRALAPVVRWLGARI